jgi:hypothetical protein
VSADVGDGPAVAVLHPVGGADAEPAVVAAGDDDIPDTGLIPISQRNCGPDLRSLEAACAGTVVEVDDKVAGVGKHDRVEAGGLVVSPRCEDVLGGGGGQVADVHPPVVEVEVE